MKRTKDMKEEFEIKSYDELVKEFGSNIIEFLIHLLTGDIVGTFFDFKLIGKGIIDIPNYRMWDNFCKFLYAGRFIDNGQAINYEMLRKLSEKLEEGGNEQENTKRILYIVSDMECDSAVNYIGCLTQALVNGMLSFKQYFRCLKVISNIIVEDIDWLAQKMDSHDIDFVLNDEATIEYVNNGLLVQNEGTLKPTRLAYDLVNYAVRWGHSSIEIPEELPGIEIIDPKSLVYYSVEDDDENTIDEM